MAHTYARLKLPSTIHRALGRAPRIPIAALGLAHRACDRIIACAKTARVHVDSRRRIWLVLAIA